MGSVTWRRAVAGDYKAVLGINEFYTFDYLPAHFHLWCQSDQYYPLVGEKAGKIVAFNVSTFLEPDGKAFTLSGGRLIASEQTFGIFKSLTKEAEKTAIKRGFICNLFTVLRGHETEKVVAGYLARGMKIVHRSRVSSYKIECSTIKDIATLKGGLSNVKPLPYSSIARHAKAIQGIIEQEGDAFLPGQNWMPFRVTSNNICLAASMSALFAGHAASIGSDGSTIVSVSFCSVFPFRSGLRMTSVFYGAREDDCEAHVHAHLKHLAEIATSDDCEIMLHHPMRLDAGLLLRKLESVLGAREKLSPQDPREMTVIKNEFLQG